MVKIAKKPKSQAGIAHILALLAVIIALGALTFVFIYVRGHRLAPASRDLTAQHSCQSPFSVAPINNKDLANITPLGNLQPPDHALPTDHIYFILNGTFDAKSGRLQTQPTSVYAPGDIELKEITAAQYFDSGGSLINSDYSLRFSPCKNVDGYFHHMSSLSDDLQKKVDGAKGKECQQYDIASGGASNTKRCRVTLQTKAGAGTALGTAGGKTAAGLDMGLTDDRLAKLSFANPRRYNGGYAQTVCPIDYYTPAVKTALQKLFGVPDNPRTQMPVCGEIMQDKAGTIQGNWFYNNAKDDPDGWTKELAIVHDNNNPDIGVISVGGVITIAGKVLFTPTNAGQLNREPSQVTADGVIYCYETNAASKVGNRGMSGRIVLQLINTTHLKIEGQTGACNTDPSFASAARTYER